MLEKNTWFRALIILLVVAVALHVGGLLWDMAVRFGDIIVLFMLAWMLAFVLRPLARQLHARAHLPWSLSVAAVYLVFFAVAVAAGVVLIPLLVSQLTQLAATVPTWFYGMPLWYESIQEHLPEQLQAEQISATLGQRDLIAQVQQLVTGLLQNALGLATSIATALFGLVIVLVLSFYFTLDGERILAGALRMVPAEHEAGARFLVECIDRTFGGFLRGQLVHAVIYGLGTAAVMWAAGLGYIVLGTTVAAVAMIIPFIGPFIATILPIGLAAIQGSWSLAVGVTIALLVLQQIVFNVIGPRIMSQAVGIHPLLVFLAVLAGAKAAGIAGAIFGVPVAAVVSAMLVFLYQRGQYPGPGPAAAQPNPASVAPRPPRRESTLP